ncbi:alpha/beta hydrolase family protein [Rothia sp. P5764]|uniref:alpha/beta hydrolase family protein n=1 Tax=Rothia sp. P5764 TaxID=3402654 RepID=UPI003AC31166
MNTEQDTSSTARTLTLATVAGVAGAAGATLAMAGALGAAGLATHFARKIVVPPKAPHEDVRVYSVGYGTAENIEDQQPTSICLDATERTQAPGRYGFYFAGGAGFALLGEVISYLPTEQTVVRSIEGVYRGDITTCKRGRLTGVVATDPQMAGYRYQDIELNLPVGPAPAWVVHPNAWLDSATESDSSAVPSSTWIVMVHGMGSTRAETLRSLTVTQKLGLTSLHVSYRNDREAPASEDGRYGLGFTEWRDIEVAIDYALSHGAEDVVLFGWSMGGSICMQTVDLASNRRAIRGLVLDGPALDWLELIRYHTQLNKIPLSIGKLGVHMISHPALTGFTGLHEPIRLEQISWPNRVQDIVLPTLILHSRDDTYVPYQPSEQLAQASPLVDFVPFTGAPHTREWNVDPELWESTVEKWLGDKLGLTLPVHQAKSAE